MRLGARTQTAAQREVTRARIVLLAARSVSNNEIATRWGISADTVRKWRGRYAGQGRDGLADRPRSGRPARFTPVQVAKVKALACRLPAEQGVPLSVWSAPELAREAVTVGIVDAVSVSTVRRWLGRGRDQALAAAYDLHQARVFGQCAPSTGIEPFMALVEHVMTQQPYASAKRVFWVVDNGSSHRGQAAIDRLAKRSPTP